METSKALLITLVLSLLVVIPFQFYAQDSGYAPDRIIVKFLDKADTKVSGDHEQFVVFDIQEVDRLNARYGCISANRIMQGRKNNQQSKVFVLQFKRAQDIPALVQEYSKTGNFQFVEPDYIGNTTGTGQSNSIPNDLYFYRQWSLYNDGTFPFLTAKTGADIDMIGAWEIEQGDSNNVTGIIDTGCKLDHPELSGRIWTNYAEIPGNGVDDDNNGYIDDVHGWSMVSSNNDPTDSVGHGTCVSGIIGANGNNEMGYAGIDWNCKLLITKVINNQNFGYYSWWAEAITYSVDNGAKVINMSLGGTSFSQLLQDAVNYALMHNVTCVAAMGNTNSGALLFPAACSGVIAAGATSPDDNRALPFYNGESGSNYGPHISVVAPGNCIFGLDNLHDYEFYYRWAGTSFATPHVAGTASLLLAQDPSRTPSEIKSIIENSAEDLVGNPYEDKPGWDPYYGHGRLNAFQALNGKKFLSVNFRDGQDITIYPNPTTGPFTLAIGSIPQGMQPEITITDMLGVVNYHAPLSSAVERLDFTSEPKGFYNVIISSGLKTWVGKLVLVR